MRVILFSTLLLAGSLVSGCGNSDGNSQGNNRQNSQSHITEAQVRQYYSDQAAALRNNDAQAICDGMAAEYHQVDITQIVGGDPEHTGTFNKTKACETARESIVLYQRLRDAGTPAVFTENIDSITIAPDGASARVQYRSGATISGRPFFEAHSDETLVRRGGRLVSTGGESRNRAYVQN